MTQPLDGVPHKTLFPRFFFSLTKVFNLVSENEMG